MKNGNVKRKTRNNEESRKNEDFPEKLAFLLHGHLFQVAILIIALSFNLNTSLLIYVHVTSNNSRSCRQMKISVFTLLTSCKLPLVFAVVGRCFE